MHVSLCESSGIPFCPDSLSHIAADTVRSSASMQRRDIRIAVQIMVFYWGKTSIGAIVSYSMLSFIMKHSRRIAFHVANSSFFEHEFWLSTAGQMISCSARGPTSRLSFWAGTERQQNDDFYWNISRARWLRKVVGPDGSKFGGQIFSVWPASGQLGR